jgi:ribonucleoside-triphosphate reductase
MLITYGRTLVGYDRHGMGYDKNGRGNVSPVTINLIKIGIKHGICLHERDKADLKGFWEELNELLELSATALVDRFYYICSQSPASAPFMYKNGSVANADYKLDKCVYESMKHGSQAIGYIGIAEMCQALFGQDHADSSEVHKFAESVVKRIADFAKESSEKYDLNFGAYASPSESTCGTVITGNREIKGLRDEFGIIPNVTDRDWATNSHHIPVWKKVDIFTKLQLEAPFTKYATSGCITYVELDSGIINNPTAIEEIIDYAFSLDIPYLAFNFPIDTCLDCGYQSEFNDHCPMCGSTHIEQLRRVTGYLTTDYRHFNKAKQAEVDSRYKHSEMTKF